MNSNRDFTATIKPRESNTTQQFEFKRVKLETDQRNIHNAVYIRKNKLLSHVQGTNYRAFLETYKTHKYILWGEKSACFEH
jgi:hypothetical protein